MDGRAYCGGASLSSCSLTNSEPYGYSYRWQLRPLKGLKTLASVPYGSIFITYLRGYIFILNQRLLREINVWSSVHHPNIAPILGLSYDFHQPGVPCIVMPYYGHGVITNYLQKQPNVSKVALVGSY